MGNNYGKARLAQRQVPGNGANITAGHFKLPLATQSDLDVALGGARVMIVVSVPPTALSAAHGTETVIMSLLRLL